MNPIVIGLLICGCIVAVIVWVLLTCLAVGAVVGWWDDPDWTGALFAAALVVVWFIATGGAGAVIAAYAQIHPGPDHGSCKVGHYYYGGKGARYFACDEWYPLPQVSESVR